MYFIIHSRHPWLGWGSGVILSKYHHLCSEKSNEIRDEKNFKSQNLRNIRNVQFICIYIFMCWTRVQLQAIRLEYLVHSINIPIQLIAMGTTLSFRRCQNHGLVYVYFSGTFLENIPVLIFFIFLPICIYWVQSVNQRHYKLFYLGIRDGERITYRKYIWKLSSQ